MNSDVELVTLIRSQPGMALRLMSTHTEDGYGCCRLCSEGAQAPHYAWPCVIYAAAAEADTGAPAAARPTTTSSRDDGGGQPTEGSR